MLLSPAAEEKWEQRLGIIILRFHYLIIKKVVYLKTQITEVFQILLLIVARIRSTNTIFDWNIIFKFSF